MQKVLITGANGFVGYYLCKQFLQKGYDVLATGKGECRLNFSEKNFAYAPMNFTNDESVKSVFEKYLPDVVIHSGAMSKPDDCELNRENAFLTNVTGTINLLNHASVNKSFFVFISTDFVFDGNKGMYKEEDERKAVNYYGETKIMAEDEVMKYQERWAIIRTVLVYGKPITGRQNILTNSAEALRREEKIKIFDDQVRTPTYVEDLAGAIVSIVEKHATGVYHISGEDIKTPYEMAVAVAEYLNLDKNLVEKVTEGNFTQPARRPLKTGFDISKAKNDLGYKPVSFEEGLKKLLGDIRLKNL